MRTKTRAVRKKPAATTTKSSDSTVTPGSALDGDGDDDISAKPTCCLLCNNTSGGGGSLLVCFEPTCPLAFHDECLRCLATVDELGNFYCPYCAYKRALALSFQARQDALSAKKALSHFIHHTQVQVQVQVLPPAHKRKANNCADDEEPPLTSSEIPAVRNPKETTPDKSKQIPIPIPVMEDSETTASMQQEDTETLATNQESVQQLFVDPPRSYSSGLNTARKETTEDRNERATTSLQNLPLKFPSRIVTGARRKKLLWTAEEEDILKEGVHKYLNTGTNISWKQILEFGCHIFHGTRTPEDLRDKWRNNLSKRCSPLKRRS